MPNAIVRLSAHITLNNAQNNRLESFLPDTGICVICVALKVARHILDAQRHSKSAGVHVSKRVSIHIPLLEHVTWSHGVFNISQFRPRHPGSHKQS